MRPVKSKLLGLSIQALTIFMLVACNNAARVGQNQNQIVPAPKNGILVHNLRTNGKTVTLSADEIRPSCLISSLGDTYCQDGVGTIEGGVGVILRPCLVNQDGTTTCEDPGDGGDIFPCPLIAGIYTCDPGANPCVCDTSGGSLRPCPLSFPVWCDPGPVSDPWMDPGPIAIGD